MRVRSDGWTHEEDMLLVNTILENVRKGSTKSEAYSSVAHKIGRSAPACGFRWNAVLSKEHLEETRDAEIERLRKTSFKNLRASRNNSKVDTPGIVLRIDDDTFISSYEESGRTVYHIHGRKMPSTLDMDGIDGAVSIRKVSGMTDIGI